MISSIDFIIVVYFMHFIPYPLLPGFVSKVLRMNVLGATIFVVSCCLMLRIADMILLDGRICLTTCGGNSTDVNMKLNMV